MSDRILHQSLEETKTVSKPWGQEKWIQQGQGDHSYVLKEITLNQGFRTSIQVHEFKAENNYILEGQGELWYSPVFFDCVRYLAGGYSADEIQHILDDLRAIIYAPGSVMSIEPGTARTDMCHNKRAGMGNPHPHAVAKGSLDYAGNALVSFTPYYFHQVRLSRPRRQKLPPFAF